MGAKTSHNSDDESGDEYGIENCYYNNYSDADFYDTIDIDEDSDSTNYLDDAQYVNWTDDENPQTRNDDVDQSDGNMNDRNADNDDYQHDARNFEYWSQFPGSPDMFADDNDEDVREQSPDNFADDNDEHDKDTSHVFRRSVKRRKVEKNEGCDYCAICPACRKSRYKSVMDYYGEESDSDADSTK